MTTKKEIISIKEATIDSLKKNAVDLIDKSNKNFYALGDTLNTIKSLMEHSSFSDWIKNELDFSHNLANKYMKIAATLDEETAVKYKVKSYALSCLSDDDRKDFLSRFDINNMSCDETEAEIRNFKLSKQATILLIKNLIIIALQRLSHSLKILILSKVYLIKYLHL